MTQATEKNLLDVSDLHVAYGKVEALTGIDLTLKEGKLVTVIGPNGAGKTTLLSAIMGILPSKGTIHFNGQDFICPNVETLVGHGLGLVPEKRELFSTMTVQDNLLLGAFQRYRRGDKSYNQTLNEIYELFPRLWERRQQQAGTLSGGERQMLAIGRAMMSKPKLLMLDEPSLGLAPLITREIFRIFTDLRSQGVSILLVEQNARAALKVADYAYVLEGGQVAMQGPASELANDPKVIEAYLGLASKHQELLSS
ncbi:High-affinity branched-chain amino acid transport ATP-binding protein LivF [Marinomonas spartinae]|uniref:High-affinity branched-chain amino acid transport ATP-binding protein LivF n=1 Tax=Marinomonas spartinae TaxID=1792290 RepID=A0A1A8TDZ3_9GAMM|nr:ABC transporter ATP-binding protein [Marinomonas spartinae]SBS30588.1 High-affinity branched-chain amino acid transport ATP-binding protein LivF [Marinomonas spartinae]SBS36494.1 High-affinity branched-chain amino acid transport ATP-binding protein LivF [Marinomonas spartinae]